MLAEWGTKADAVKCYRRLKGLLGVKALTAIPDDLTFHDFTHPLAPLCWNGCCFLEMSAEQNDWEAYFDQLNFFSLLINRRLDSNKVAEDPCALRLLSRFYSCYGLCADLEKLL